jgi:hypothetical protein
MINRRHLPFVKPKSQKSAFLNCRHMAFWRVLSNVCVLNFCRSIVGNLESASSMGPVDAARGDSRLSDGVQRTRPCQRSEMRKRAGRLLPMARAGHLLLPRRRSALTQLRTTARCCSRCPGRGDYKAAVVMLQQCPTTPPLPPDAARHPPTAAVATAAAVAAGNIFWRMPVRRNRRELFLSRRRKGHKDEEAVLCK